MKLSTDEILNAASDMAQRMAKDPSLRHLDIGPGHGDLIALLRSKFRDIFSSACDYTTHLMQLTDVPIKVGDLNRQNLPYESAEFNLITCTEITYILNSDSFNSSKTVGGMTANAPVEIT